MENKMSQTDDCQFVARADNNMRSVALDGIEYKADSLAIDANSMRRYFRILEDMPIYETRAEDALDRAEASLAEALQAVKVAKAHILKFR